VPFTGKSKSIGACVAIKNFISKYNQLQRPKKLKYVGKQNCCFVNTCSLAAEKPIFRMRKEGMRTVRLRLFVTVPFEWSRVESSGYWAAKKVSRWLQQISKANDILPSSMETAANSINRKRHRNNVSNTPTHNVAKSPNVTGARSSPSRPWTTEEDVLLQASIKSLEQENGKLLQSQYQDRQCLKRRGGVLKQLVRHLITSPHRCHWSDQITDLKNWGTIFAKIPGSMSKQCLE
jgi:hypothetical protein